MALVTSEKVFNVVKQPMFQGRVKSFMSSAAVAVMAETNTTNSHVERVAYANKVLDGSASVIEYAYAVMSNPTLKAAVDAGAENDGITDGDMEFAVSSVFNAMAGVTT
jgi:hypothetical protein